MKQLTIVRHAKAGWGDATLSDFQRPLNERGLKDSVTMAQRLLAQGLVPQCLVTSPALRALTTAQQFAETLSLASSAFTTDKNIYEASNDRLHDVVWGLDDRYDDIMLVGHNPGLSDLVRSLVSAGIDELSTCEIIVVQFDCEQWHEIGPGSGRISFNDLPRNTHHSA